MPRLSLIAALTTNRVIGRDGGLPWSLPDDMAWFKAATSGHAVITGRANFEVENKPLPNRHNIVLTRDANWSPPRNMATPGGVTVAHSIDTALALVDPADPEPFVIGGSAIYELALPRADRLYLTHIDAHIEGDTYFPEFDIETWRIVDERHHRADARHAYAMTFKTYDRCDT